MRDQIAVEMLNAIAPHLGAVGESVEEVAAGVYVISKIRYYKDPATTVTVSADTIKVGVLELASDGYMASGPHDAKHGHIAHRMKAIAGGDTDVYWDGWDVATAIDVAVFGGCGDHGEDWAASLGLTEADWLG